MAVTDFNLPQNPHVYQLLHSLNAAFGRAYKRLDAIGQLGIVHQQIMQQLFRRTQELQATCNSQLLAVLKEIESRNLSELHKNT